MLPFTTIRKGAVDAIKQYVASQGGSIPTDLEEKAAKIATAGGTPLAVAAGAGAFGRDGAKSWFRCMHREC